MLASRLGLRSATLCPQPHKRRRLSTAAAPPVVDPQPRRILFFGADAFSCHVFARLHAARADLVESLTVVTPPDQRIGRRLKDVHRPPLRLLAEELGVSAVSLPSTLLRNWQPPEEFLSEPQHQEARIPSQNLLLTASFGHLIPNSLLSLFDPLNALNVHPSLLPRWRGAAPIQHGIIQGDADGLTGEPMGVTVQELSRGKFDRGRILAQRAVDVPHHADFLTLEPILAHAGGDLLVTVLSAFEAHKDRAQPQSEQRACLAPKLNKESARVDWSQRSAAQVCRLQRGIGHQHPLWTTLAEAQLQLRLAPIPVPLPETLVGVAPGSAILDSATKAIVLRCADSLAGAELLEVKKEGGRWVKARDWWNGARASMQDGIVLFQ